MRVIVLLYKQTVLSYNTDRVGTKTMKIIKYKLGKTVITNEDITQILEIHFLVDKDTLGTKFSNYKALKAYIDSRVERYSERKVMLSICLLNFKDQVLKLRNYVECPWRKIKKFTDYHVITSVVELYRGNICSSERGFKGTFLVSYML